MSLNHAVLYAGDLSKQQNFYENVLGMRVTDTVPRLMTLLRCNPNHHSFGFIAHRNVQPRVILPTTT